MKIAITGRSGFVGSHLVDYLSNECNHEVLPVSRMLLYEEPESLAEYLEGCDAVIHLAGANILSRWTTKRKRVLWNSRVDTTQKLVEAFRIMKQAPKCFISTSATGIFKDNGVHDERSDSYSEEFLGQLARQWEIEASKAGTLGIRTLIFRLGVVLDKDGGALAKMLPAFQLGLGGAIGSGEQAFPFIHLRDLLRAYNFVLQHQECEGVYHLVAPELITNKEFIKVLAKVLKRPTLFRIPSSLLKLLFSDGASVLVQGQKVLAHRLPESGFQFEYPRIDLLLRDLLD